jgi:hypothetical protein
MQVVWDSAVVLELVMLVVLELVMLVHRLLPSALTHHTSVSVSH